MSDYLAWFVGVSAAFLVVGGMGIMVAAERADRMSDEIMAEWRREHE
jgi:hypothetical protein